MRQPSTIDARVKHPAIANKSERSRRTLLVLVFVGFISLGLPDGLLGVAWPSIRQTFGISLDALGPLLLTTAAGYLMASASSGWIVDRLGIGLLLALSGLATALGLLGYALAPDWPVMVVLGLAAGLGAGAIDAGLNAYVALNHSPRLLNWLHASFGLGAAIGPAIMMTVLDAGLAWRWGYVIVGLLQAALGTCFWLTANRWRGAEADPPLTIEAIPVNRVPAAAWRLAIVWLSITLFFVYTGLETTAGQWSYSLFTESREAAPHTASLWVSIYWGNLAIGRLLFGFVANRLAPVLLLRLCMLGILSGAVFIWLAPSPALSFVGLGLIGLAAAPIFPSLIANTPRRLGAKLATSVIGFQVGAASLGIAVMPGLAGVLAERLGLEMVAPFLVITAIVMLALHEALVARAR